MEYQTCTLEELAAFIETSPHPRIARQLHHYRKTGNEEMVAKILKARAIANKNKLVKKLEAME